MRRAIVIGASSGIGRALAEQLSESGYRLGLAARRRERLEELRDQLGDGVVKTIDLADSEQAIGRFSELVDELGGVDLVVIASGILRYNPDLRWELERETIDVNVSGFTAIATVAMNHFMKQGFGHLVSISSIGALRGSDDRPAYGASKAYVSTYVDGLRRKAVKARLPIAVTDVLPGFVETAMSRQMEHLEPMFWVASPEEAAKQILRAIEKKKKLIYVSKRWRLIAWFTKLAPDFVYNRLA